MKATKAQIQQRVEDVLKIRLEGAAFWNVREYAREKEAEEGSAWFLPPGCKPLSDAQLWRYIARADKLAAQNYLASRKRLFRRHLIRREHLYALALNQGDVRAALAVLADAADLEGLRPPRKVAPTTPDGSAPYEPNMPDAERVAALAALHARMGLAGGGAHPPGQALPDGQVLGGPGAGDDGRTDGAGRMAEDVTPLFPQAHDAVDDAPGGQEHDGGGAGPQDRLA
jgi:hypothetical protein